MQKRVTVLQTARIFRSREHDRSALEPTSRSIEAGTAVIVADAVCKNADGKEVIAVPFLENGGVSWFIPQEAGLKEEAMPNITFARAGKAVASESMRRLVRQDLV